MASHNKIDFVLHYQCCFLGILIRKSEHFLTSSFSCWVFHYILVKFWSNERKGIWGPVSLKAWTIHDGELDKSTLNVTLYIDVEFLFEFVEFLVGGCSSALAYCINNALNACSESNLCCHFPPSNKSSLSSGKSFGCDVCLSRHHLLCFSPFLFHFSLLFYLSLTKYNG